ncbi:DUF1467 family protein [Seohaeicola zhoushanensis]|uniref:Uncharacterized protein n=1 Tax=Seohaeicola zhoushanensis TaxID=1569283 RepID=A0A8J3GVS9_9RHOB|nr:DUF1467 family protein [Seohaeicola zhoushanensis]GHF40877.1 hypothetical protein GCM10017056_10600 [Seohaeicola zhoushanensis]
MGPVSGIVLYVIIWFLCFFVALPMRLRTQGDSGSVVPGTHSGAPEVHHLKRKAIIVSVVALVIWAIVATIILSGWITMDDIDVFRPTRWD